jgi:uncharacterized Zn finger protein
MPARRRSSGFNRPRDGWWPPPSKPIRVEGGIQARSQHGRIGDTWWSQRFITVLQLVGVAGRLQRGKNYARTGQVLSMDIAAGEITASVQGSRAKPYSLSIKTKVLSVGDWDAAESVMESSAIFMATLLAGDMPEDIEEAFSVSSSPLFPASAREFDSECSCPDWENPCKHIAAVYFLLAEAFDDDPFLIFTWRGRTKAEILANLRGRRRASGARDVDAVDEPADPVTDSGTGPFGWPAADPDRPSARSPELPASFWGRDEDLVTIEIRPRLAVAPDLVLRQLDPAPLSGDASSITGALRPFYEAMTTGAAALALGEDTEEQK